MKKFLIMAAMVLSSVGAFAQAEEGTLTLQPKIGLNVSNAGDQDWKANFAVGAELQYQVTNKFGLAGGVLYSVQGYKGKSVTVNGLEIKATDWTPSYLNIPLTANYYVAKGLAIKAGVQPGIILDKDHGDNVKTFDLSIPVGLSYEFSNFVFDARYNIGVTKVADNYDGYNNVLQITFGYKFKL